jgi:hypothetical protein
VTAVLECAGAPRDLGGDQGRGWQEALAAYAGGGLLARLRALARPADPATRRALAELKRHFPHQWEQLEGMARGAGASPRDLGGAMLETLAELAGPGPVAFVHDSAPRLGCWLPPGARPRRARPEGRFQSVELTLPILTTPVAGVNEAGLGLATGFGPCRPEPGRAPAALLLRDCLERFESVEPALAWCLGRPAGPPGLILLADASGDVAGVEILPAERRVRRPVDGLLVLGRPGAREAALAKALCDPERGECELGRALEAALCPADPVAFAQVDPVRRRLRPAHGAWLEI